MNHAAHGYLFDDKQITKAGGEGLAAVGGDGNDVFDAGGEGVELGDAGFDGEEHAFLQDGFVTSGEEGGFMDVHADAVAQAVAKFVAVAGFGDEGASGGVYVGGPHLAGTHGGNADSLGFHHQVVNTLKFLIRLTEENGTAKIVAEALICGPKIKQDRDRCM